MGQEGHEEEEDDEKETDHHDDDDDDGGGCCIGVGARARTDARDPSQVWAQRGRAIGSLASSACDILATRGSEMLCVRLSSQFRLRHPSSSGIGDDAREIVMSYPRNSGL